jgi:PKD repeat protein
VVDPDSAPDFQYVWTFPDELRSTNPTPSLLVREPTPYPVGVVVVDQEGNPSVLYWHYLAITNVPPSILSVTPTSGAEGDTLAFSAVVADAGSPTRHHYEWTLPDATKSVERSPSYWFSQPGDYPLSLTVRELGLEYVYNNSRETGPRLMFYSDLRETGDESVVVGTNRVLSEFQFAYWGDLGQMSEEELNEATARLRIYAGNGPVVTISGKRIVTPGDLLFESPAFPLYPGLNWKAFRDLNIELPGTFFMWTFQAAGVPQLPGKAAGLVFYNSVQKTALDLGRSYNDYWRRRDDGSWWLYNFGAKAVANFGCRAVGITTDYIAASDPLAATVTITNTPPVIAALNGMDKGLVGAELKFSAVATDAGGGLLTCRWDFGDGATATGPEVSHAYQAAGQYTVELNVSDPQGAVARRALPVEITPDLKALLFTSLPTSSVKQGEAYRYAITTIEPGAGQNLQITAPVLPGWLSLADHLDGTALLTGLPGEAQVGSQAVTLQLSDGVAVVTQSFTIVVENVNDPPTISAIAGQTIRANAELGPLPFTVGDPDTPLADLTLTAISSNSSLAPNAHLRLEGTGANRTVSLRPVTGLSGSTTVTLTVSDGQLSASSEFNVVVTPPVFYALTVLPGTGGQVLVDPVLAEYPEDTEVTLAAQADAGYSFAAWEGDVTGQVSPVKVVMNAPKQVKAAFRDSTPPTIAILTPAAGPSANQVVSLTGTIEDNVGVASAQWERDGVLEGQLALTAGRFQVTGLTLTRGEHQFAVQATDLSGNAATSRVAVSWAPGVVLTVVSPGEQREGKLLRTAIMLTSDGRVGGMTFNLAYDADYLGEPELEWSSLISLAFTEVNTDTPGQVRATFSLPGTTVPAGVEAVGILNLRVRSVPFSLTSLIEPTVEEVSDVLGMPLNTGTDAILGSARLLKRSVIGDLNANNRLDVGDAHLLQRLVAGLDVARTWDLGLNDLNRNNQLDSGDVGQVLRVVVGLDPQPRPQGEGPHSGEVTLSSAPFQAENVAWNQGMWPIVPEADPARGGGLADGRAGLHSAAPKSPKAVLLAPMTPVKGGDTFTAKVMLQDVDHPITGVSFRLRYPARALRLATPTSFRAGTLVPAKAVKAWNSAAAEGLVSFGATLGEAWPSANGLLADFTFIVVGTVPDKTGWALAVENLEVSKNGYENGEYAAAPGEFQTGVQFSPSQIEAFGLGVDGAFDLKVATEAGQQLLLETSTDLVNWMPYLTLPSSGAYLRFTDPGLAQTPIRFFRIKAFLPAGSLEPPVTGGVSDERR